MTLLWNLCDSSGPKCVFIDTDRFFYCSDIKNRVSVAASRKKYTATEATKILSEWEAIDFADYDSDTESSSSDGECTENENDPETVLLEPVEEVILVDNSDTVPNKDDLYLNIINEVKEKVSKNLLKIKGKLSETMAKRKR